MLRCSNSLKNGGGNLLKTVTTNILADGTRLFHCGDLKERKNKLFHYQCEGVIGGLCHAELIGNCPSPMEEGVGERVQLEEKINPSLKIVSFHKMLKDNFSLSLGERSKNPCDQSEIIRSSLTDLLQFNCLSLRKTNAFKKCAFTLAEVLITLGIIGVVAAMTIPTLMANIKAHQYSAKFKKTVSTLSNAAKMSQAQYGFDYSGLTDKCNAKSGTDNPEDKQSLCSLLNGTLTGATYYYGMNNFPNYEIKTSATFNSWSSFKDNKNKIPIYQLSDGSIILFSAVLGEYSSIKEPCARYIGGDPGFIASGAYKGWGTGCYALIDVNGVSKPNKEVKCTRGTNKLSTMEAGNCIVEPKDMGDIFPVIIYDGAVSPFSAAAAYAFSNAK